MKMSWPHEGQRQRPLCCWCWPCALVGPQKTPGRTALLRLQQTLPMKPCCCWRLACRRTGWTCFLQQLVQHWALGRQHQRTKTLMLCRMVGTTPEG